MPLAIDRAAKVGLANQQHSGPSLRPHPRAGAQHDGIAEQHGERAAIAEADDFGERFAAQFAAGSVADTAQRADRNGQPGNLQQPAIASGDKAVAMRREIGLRGLHSVEQIGEGG